MSGKRTRRKVLVNSSAPLERCARGPRFTRQKLPPLTPRNYCEADRELLITDADIEALQAPKARKVTRGDAK